MHEAIPFGNWEKRWHPLRREWVVYAAHRNSRPWNFEKKESVNTAPEYDPGCYLCPRNKRISGKQNPDYADVFIFENDHPVVGLSSPSIPGAFQSVHDGLYKRSQAGGIAKVVCYDPRHNVTLNDISVDKVATVFRALRDEMVFFNNHETIKSVLIFENKGEVVGVSNPHPHCQIYAVDFTINVVRKELDAAAAYQKEKGRNIFSDIIDSEKKDDIRIVAENKGAIAFIPYFARFAYETYVFPKNRHATLITMTDDELYDLAEVFQTTARKFDANFQSSFPYIMAFAQAPVDGNEYPDYHMHLIICPPLRQPGLMKYLAGPETGADTFMADTMPEEKSRRTQEDQIMNDFFSNDEEIIHATAPGRMDVMGGIADYSGSLLLQMPIKQTTAVGIQIRNDGIFNLRTQVTKKKTVNFTIHFSELRESSLSEAGEIIKAKEGGDWAVYVLGCFLVLQKEKNIVLTGANVFIESNVPWGKGVSSSAALEVATMNALDHLYRLSLGREQLAVYAQMAENLVAGAPCGLMDQLSSHLGQKNKLLPLVCQPHEVSKPISIPKGINFSGIDSGIRHAVSGASYGDVRAAAFMSYTIIALNDGATVQDLSQARSSGDWRELPYKGFLANIPVSTFEEKYLSLLPTEISGKDFIDQYKVSIDTVTNIDEQKTYKPVVCGSHPVYENARVNEFKTLLQTFRRQDDKQAVLTQMGNLMMQSHESYSAVGLGNEYTDKIVEMIREAGAVNGVYGARVSGGGNGGTVCILSYDKEGKKTVKNIHRNYQAMMKKKLFFFSGSSQGAYVLNQYI